MKPRTLPVLLVSLFFALFAFSSTAFAQNGSHLDVDEDRTYGDTPQEQVQEPAPPQTHSDTQGLEQRSDDVVVVERPAQVSWASVLARNTIAGGVTGGLIGLGIWLLTDRGISPWTVAQFAGGGILVGAALGAVELIVRPDIYALEPPSSVLWVQQDAPQPLMMPLLNQEF